MLVFTCHLNHPLSDWQLGYGIAKSNIQGRN
jgi:hypothetical protein